MKSQEVIAFLRSHVLPQYFYHDTFLCLREVIGKVLVSEHNGELCAGVIVEAEAYVGAIDKACHAYDLRRTKRTEVMFGKPGVAYMYTVHTHNLLNLVTDHEGTPDAILIRAVEPFVGIEVMQQRRGYQLPLKQLTNGPGKLCDAMHITMAEYGLDLTRGKRLWLAEHPHAASRKVWASRRIGIDYAEDFRDVPWRFFDPDSPFVSKRLKGEEFSVITS